MRIPNPSLSRISLFLMLPIWVFCFSACETLQSLSDTDIVAGLKQALSIGADTSVASASKADGYFMEPRIKIPFPEDAIVVKNTLDQIGLGGLLVDPLILKLNRAAEDAADRALPIFLDAITNMSIEDGLAILQGTDDAATSYLKTQTFDSLKTTFQPEIETSLDAVGATTAWTAVIDRYNQIPFVPAANADLPDYTTRKALDGLFVLIADQELRIRTDVNARITDLLREVFAEQD